MKIAVLFVGNTLMMDDGLGPEAHKRLTASYEFPPEVSLFNVGCMSLDMINMVGDFDFMMTVDALDGTGEEPGTVFRYLPDDVARRGTPMASLHQLKLADLFDAALLLGFEAQGLCLGMQVENAEPAELWEGLTPKVEAAMPLLMETVVAELTKLGYPPRKKADA